MKLRGAGMVAALLLGGCTNVPLDVGVGPEPNEQTFGPEYPVAPPAGRRLVRLDSAELSPDQLTLTVKFVGGSPYLASNPCSEDYEPWVAMRDDELDVEIVNVDRPGQATLGPNSGCTLEGHGHTYHLKLGAPFTGAIVNDLANGSTFFIGEPADALAVAVLPTGWSLQRAFQEGAGTPSVWVEIYAAGPVGESFEGLGQLVLYQAFGESPEWSDNRAAKSEQRGGHKVAVTLHDSATVVWVDEASGELLIAWTLEGRSLGLIGNAADMTVAQLVSYAESVAPAMP